VKPFRFHREADAEFTDALNHYAGIGPLLGGHFYDEVEKVIAAACAHPQRSRQIDPPVRRALVSGFPYALLYIDEADRVWIVAVAPLKRDPDYWKHRLTN
jgi:plasmid stabilization system protein ParE